MVTTWSSETNCLEFWRRSLPKDARFCLHSVGCGSALSDYWIQFKKVGHNLVQWGTGNHYDPYYNDYFTPFNTASAKSGYHCTGEIASTPTRFEYGSTKSAYGSTTYSQANQPHDTHPTTFLGNLKRGYQKAIVPDGVDDTILKANHALAVQDLPYTTPYDPVPSAYPYGTYPIYMNHHNFRHPIYYGQNRPII